MPRFLILRKSGVHRAACFALYRALLHQKHELQLTERQQHLFRKPIRAIFKRNSKLQSPPQISTALRLGYETLEGLHDGVRKQKVLNRILELASLPQTSARLGDLSSSPRTKTASSQKPRKRDAIPYPGTTPVLARPFQDLSGRRHVPVLINANRVPFLRLKKPQPPFLSRIIRDTVNTRELRITRAERLTSEISIAEDEDDWDQILYNRFGMDYMDTEGEPWDREVKRASDRNHKLQVEAIKKRADVAAEMYAIVEQEKALAEEQKLRKRDEKHKATKARRLARRGWTEPDIQEKLYPQTEKTVTRDSLAETQKNSNPVQEEARKPNTELQWRKRGDKYKTSDELKQLYEASFKPKTDEEMARIKEARARRKEEESERKAEKWKRKQENIAFWEQKLNNKAEDSTNKRLGSEK
ncbi:MAG: hypothetical protein ALECFALPRED_003430 [Alectoria fallacina]|uniref:Complex 1 LYR protein domain-containing protein n=1 Tax=Alectoria fallacina TaxID=1903189 RepID=A0A8H3FKP4_9LECA|nr:MAG: hypothetical protein ALECFALPRED_003430 [Alectoria fallacina]